MRGSWGGAGAGYEATEAGSSEFYGILGLDGCRPSYGQLGQVQMWGSIAIGSPPPQAFDNLGGAIAGPLGGLRERGVLFRLGDHLPPSLWDGPPQEFDSMGGLGWLGPWVEEAIVAQLAQIRDGV